MNKLTLDGIEMSETDFKTYWYINWSDEVVSFHGRVEGDKLVSWDDEGKISIEIGHIYGTRKAALKAALAMEIE